MTSSTAILAQLSSASAVEAPRCGMTIARYIFTTAGLAKSVT